MALTTSAYFMGVAFYLISALSTVKTIKLIRSRFFVLIATRFW